MIRALPLLPIALLAATPAMANEFKLALQLDETAQSLPREAALAATADTRATCAGPAETSEDCAIGLISAADILAGAGLFDQAERDARQAVGIMERLRGASHPDSSLAYGILGSVLLRAGRYDAAEPVLRQALLGLESAAEADPELRAGHLMNLGIVLAEQQRYAEAEPLLRRALAVREKDLPDNVLEIATAHANIGALLHRMGRLDEAMTAHQAALTIRREQLKGADYDLGTTMLNIAETLALSPDAARLIAEPYLRAGLMTRESVLSPGDPRTTQAQTMLGENLESQGKAKAALELYAQAYASAYVGSTIDSPVRIHAAWNLARLLTGAGVGLPMARSLYREAAGGVTARMAGTQEFDERSRADLDRWRGVFGGQIRADWALASAKN